MRKFLLICLLVACGPTPVRLDDVDSGVEDSGVEVVDSGTRVVDAGTSAVDAGDDEDAGRPDAGCCPRGCCRHHHHHPCE
jgi:hypothetical protein